MAKCRDCKLWEKPKPPKHHFAKGICTKLKEDKHAANGICEFFKQKTK